MWHLAARNVLRHRRRSLLAVTLIAVGVAALVLANGYNRFTFWGLRQVATHQYGHLQIARPAFWQNRGDARQRLMDASTVQELSNALQTLPEVDAFYPALSVSGLMGTADVSTVFLAEATPSDVPWDVATASVREGRRLLAGDRERVVVGTGLAETLGVEVGDWVTIFAATVDGAYNAANAQIVGLSATGLMEADARLAAMPLEDARRLLNTDGANRVVVLLRGDPGQGDAAIAAAADRIRQALQAAGLGDLEVRTRADLATFMNQVQSLYVAIFGFLTVVIFGVVLVSILESLTLSFFERIREMGTLMAIGTSRGQLFAQLVLEGAILGVAGALAGAVLGWALGEAVNHAQLTYTPPMTSEPVPLGVRLDWATAAAPASVGVVAAVLSAIYPAWIATRLQVVEALRHV